MNEQRIHLKSHFGFSKIPFTKYMWATKMFDASAQRELIDGLHFWLETRGIALLYGPAGVGKSITLRRFREELDDRRFDLFYLFNLRVTPTGLLRSLCRLLGLPVLYHQADLFDAISAFLGQYEERNRKYPIILFDDGDGLSDRLLELLRLLGNFSMDSEDRFSFILSGTQKLALRLKEPQNEALKQRIVFSHQKPLRR
jgi:type II secretory pathway predicted ATPase ExeA